MPFNALRNIPTLSKVVNSRATPNYILMKHLMKQELSAPLKQDFVSKIMEEKLTAENGLDKAVFELPMKGTEELPFHISRSLYGQLPVYLDYK